MISDWKECKIGNLCNSVSETYKVIQNRYCLKNNSLNQGHQDRFKI